MSQPESVPFVGLAVDEPSKGDHRIHNVTDGCKCNCQCFSEVGQLALRDALQQLINVVRPVRQVEVVS